MPVACMPAACMPAACPAAACPAAACRNAQRELATGVARSRCFFRRDERLAAISAAPAGNARSGPAARCTGMPTARMAPRRSAARTPSRRLIPTAQMAWPQLPAPPAILPGPHRGANRRMAERLHQPAHPVVIPTQAREALRPPDPSSVREPSSHSLPIPPCAVGLPRAPCEGRQVRGRPHGQAVQRQKMRALENCATKMMRGDGGKPRTAPT